MRRISRAIRVYALLFMTVSALSYGQSGPAGVLIAPQNSFLSVGSAQQFTATRSVNRWLSSNPAVATVNGSGQVTGMQAGTATITAISGTFRTSSALTVVALPTALSFFPGVPTIAAGQSTILTPTFAAGTGVVNGSDGSKQLVTNAAPIVVSPVTTTTYTLVVTNSAGSADNHLSTTVTVAPAPSITSFGAAAGIINNGSSAVLTANFTGGSGAITNNQDSSMVAATSGTPVNITPASNATTIYTLTVTGANGSTAAATTAVQTVVTPQFLGGSFSGSPSIVTAGSDQTVTLAIPTFSSGATGVITNSVNNSILNATPAQGSFLTVNVNTTTTFILTETNAAKNSIAAALTVTAVSAPTATSLIPSMTTVTSGNSVLLAPVFSNGSGTIDNGVGTVGSGSVVSTGPLSSDTIFRLTVINAAGAASTSVAPNVHVITAPSIVSFTASPSMITSGTSTTLTGTFSNGIGVITNNVDGTSILVTSGVGVQVSPTQDVIYTLTVTNAAGTAKTANTLVDVN